MCLPTAAKMLKVMSVRPPDLILLDIQMPGMSGLEALSIVKNDPVNKDVPIILFSGAAQGDTRAVTEGLELGAVDFVGKPFAPGLLKSVVMTHLSASRLRRRVESQNELLERNRRELASLENDFESLVQAGCRQAKDGQDAIVDTVAKLVDYRVDRNVGTAPRDHQILEAMIKALKARGLYAEQISRWDLDVMLQSARLHDVGKLALSQEILAKPGKLTESEYEQIKRHPSLGVQILSSMEERSLEHALLRYAKVFAETHQERWDGTGYPAGLKGEDIPLPGRLMAINSVYQALTTDRPWKRALSHDEAVRIIEEGQGTHFDPLLVGVFVEVADAFRPAA
jgi:putative two-component system response regulator